MTTADAAVVRASKQHRVELSIPRDFGVEIGFRAAVHVDENRSARTSAPRLRDFFGVVCWQSCLLNMKRNSPFISV